MLFLKSWLEEYINLSGYTDNEISDLLSLRSGECESVEVINEYFDNKVVIGRIENLKKHPEADRLNVFDVNIGNGNKVQIVSAAPNARDGLICPVALDGAKLPYITIIPRKMRGIESQGMCCGMSELALETEFSSGLWELNNLVDEKDLGKSICEALPNFFPVQTIFEIKYLQDKLASCANHLGLAMEIAVCLQKPELLRGLGIKVYEFDTQWCDEVIQKIKPSEIQIQLTDRTESVKSYAILDIKLDKAYNLNHIYQTRMFLTGKNLVGGLVDLSNYLLFDMGQPNHFFSADKIENYEWKFDKLESNVDFQGLGQFKNGLLPKGLSVLKDAKDNILIVPGITGSDSTKTEINDLNVLIEIANFDKELVARNSSAMNYRSDSAKVFASGVNYALSPLLMYRLIQELPEAEISHSLLWDGDSKLEDSNEWIDFTIHDAYSDKIILIDLVYIADRLDSRGIDYWEPIIIEKLNLFASIYTVSIKTIKEMLTDGLFDSDEEAEKSILEKFPVYEDMSFEEYYKDSRFIGLDAFYGNIQTDEDVLFEIAKLIGFDNLEPEFLNFSVDSKTQNYYQQLNYLKNIFGSFGFSEVITRPFLPENKLFSTFLRTNTNALIALSSQRKDEPFLRDSLFSSLLSIANSNIKLGIKEPKIFELTKIYLHSENQTNSLSNSLDETKVWEHFELSGISCSQDPYLLTSLISQIQKKFGLEMDIKHLDENYSKIGNGYSYRLQDAVQINLIEIKNSIKKTFNLPLNKTIWYLEIKFNPNKIDYNTYQKFADQSNFPIIERSYSLMVPKELQWFELEQILKDELVSDTKINITPIERIDGEIDDKLNYKIEFFSYSRTMLGTEIEDWETKVMINLKNKYSNIELR
jgi:phenylalanyl-tRNA synthetase beta subunit